MIFCFYGILGHGRIWRFYFLHYLRQFFLGPDLGIFIGVGLSLLLIVKQSTFPHIVVLGEDKGGQWIDKEKDLQAKAREGILVIRVEEGLYFSNIEIVKDMFKRIQLYGSLHAHPTDSRLSAAKLTKCIIVHASSITDMDASATQVLCEMVHDYQKQDIFVCFVKLRPHIKKMFVKSAIIGALGGNRVFSSLTVALTYVEENVLGKNSGNKQVV